MTFFPVRWPGTGGPAAVIRRRTRSDYRFPGLGQAMAWRLWWEHTPVLIDDVRGTRIEGSTGIARRGAGQIAAGLAAATGQLMRPGCPGSPRPIRGETWQWTRYYEDRPGGCTAARLPGTASAPFPASASREEQRGVPPPG